MRLLKPSLRQEDDTSLTTSTSRTKIPLRYHARLRWLGAESQMGWLSVNETWRKLIQLQVDITPFLEEKNDGEERQ